MSIIKPHIMAMSAYKPPLEGRNPERHTLLDFNERTIPIGDTIVEALTTYIHSGRLQQYPAYGDITQRLADYAGVKSDQVMITNGSDQGIDLIFRAVAKAGAEAIIPGPTFAMYQQCAKVEAMAIIEPLYTQAEGYPLTEVLDSINDNTAIIVVSNPNNPCGTKVDGEAILSIAKAAPHAAILVDECYYEYSRETVVPYLADNPNIFITRTFSKTWGIPALRFGYLLAAPEYIQALCNVRGPYDINQLAIVAAQAALDNPGYTAAYVDEVMNQAKPLFEQWLDKKNIQYWLSSANYVWLFPEQPEQWNDYLSRHGVLVRPKDYRGKMGLRVTIGTLEQMQRVLELMETLTQA